MRYERDDSLWRAAVIIRDRIMALPEYKSARGAVVAAVLARVRVLADLHGGTDGAAFVGAMRLEGGFTEMLLAKVKALPDEYRVNHGSPLWPRTVCDELLGELGSMREEVQWTLVRERQRPRPARSTSDFMSESERQDMRDAGRGHLVR